MKDKKRTNACGIGREQAIRSRSIPSRGEARGGESALRFYEINPGITTGTSVSKPRSNRVTEVLLRNFETRHAARRNQATKQRTNERDRNAVSAVGASLSQSHQTTVIATGATSHRALDVEANTITLSLSLSSSAPLSVSLPPPLSRPLFPALAHPPFASSFNLNPLRRLVPSPSPSRGFVLRRVAELRRASVTAD